jgi:ATP-dependent DNA helicase RecG
VAFKRLGLAVIDEQHRFGVHQRLALQAKGGATDLLVMTATPIPRTLALTAYGDMDVSTLRQKPPGRQPITTQVMSDEKLAELAQRLRAVLERGEQAYWVCPLVEESEEVDLADATSRHLWLSQLYGAGRVGLLHGRLKPTEKVAVMEAFKRGEIGILVSTTVVEVGGDVPNASVMVIEHAERFGLAQLHQLRGRVGRGTNKSSCILVYSPPLGEYGQARLAALRQSEDGFYLAEADLELRGPGEVLGTQQAGAQRTRLADLVKHKDLIPVARDLAEKALTQRLNAAQRNALALLLEAFGKTAAATFLRAG